MKCILFSFLLCTSGILFSQWYKVYEAPDICLKDIAFADPSHGFAIAEDLFLYTEDGGETWLQDSAKTGNFYVVDFVGQDSGYICCEPDGGGKILYTHDGGSSWLHNEEEDPVSIYDIEFVQNDEAIGMTYTGSFAATVRAIETCNLWGFENTIGPGYSWDIEFPVADTGFLSGELSDVIPSTVYKTTDGGESWYTNENMRGPIYYLTFPSASIGYGVGYESRVWKTIDGGETWFMLDFDFGGFDVFDLDLSIGKIYFYSNNVGYLEATAYNPHLYKTIDGGLTWGLTDDGVVDFAGANGFVCTDANTCFFIDCNSIYKTTNGGGIGTSITEIQPDQISFSISPNPSSDFIGILLDPTLDVRQIITTNYLGQIVTLPFEGKLLANANSLPSGIYFTQIITDKGRGIKKWVKR